MKRRSPLLSQRGMDEPGDILSLALESSGIPSKSGRQGSQGVDLTPTLEALFSVPPDRSGHDVHALLATSTSIAPPTQGRGSGSVGSSGQSTAFSLAMDPFASDPFGDSKKLSLEEVLDVVLNEPGPVDVRGTRQSTNIAPLFDSSSPYAMDAGLSPELDLALNAALFGSTDLPTTPSDSHVAVHGAFLPTHATSMPQVGRQSPASAVSLPSVARHTVAAPSPLVHSTVAPRQPHYPATSAPLRAVSQPAAMTGVVTGSSQTPGLALAARPPM